jgi:VWFA-related protein
MKTWAMMFLGFVAALVMISPSAAIRAAKGEAILRVETRLVQVSVVARDSNGHAIQNLTKDDFKLYDNGKEVPIDVFSGLTITPTAPEPLPPNVFSNRVQGAQPSITVVLLDGLNTSFHDQSWARTQVVRFLEELRPEDRVAIFLLGEHLHVLQNFTSNPQLLLAALRNAKIRNPREVDGSAPPPLGFGEPDQASVNVMGPGYDPTSVAQAISSGLPAGMSSPGGNNAASAGSPSTAAGMAAAGAGSAYAEADMLMAQTVQHESDFFGNDRVQRTLDALIAIANYLGQFRGRKNLIWVSSSFPVSVGLLGTRQPGDTRDQIHFAADFDRAYKTLNSALNKADLAIYPVDARGLTAGAPGTMDMNDFYSTVGTMKELASQTGGQAFINTNDLARVMRAAADDSEASYTLGFYCRDIRWDNKYHALKVKVSQPGVHLRYRQGYFATREAAKTPKTGDQVDTLFNQALYSPLDSMGVGLRVTLEKVTHHTDTRRNMATNKIVPFHKDRALLGINVDAHDISLKSGSDGGSVQLVLVLAQSGPDGKVLDAARYDMKMRVATGGVQRLQGKGLQMEKWVDLVQGATSLELVVRDPASGVLGSVRIPVGGV